MCSGTMFSKGKSVDKDLDAAFSWYMKAAEQDLLFLGSIDFFEPYPVYCCLIFYFCFNFNCAKCFFLLNI